MNGYNVAVVGVGAVGEEMLRVLKQRQFPTKSLKVLARSARTVNIDGDEYSVGVCAPEEFDGVQIALFAGTEGEKGAAVQFAEEATKRGAVVIDNGADFRMDPKVPLVVPEVNPDDVTWHKGIIANPNCSTIQMVVALKPIHDISRITRVVVSTYQAVSGTGRAAIRELDAQARAWAAGQPMPAPEAYPKQIAFNVLPHIGGFNEHGYTSEEWKMIVETHKILHDDSIKITATTVRVPVFNGHSEAVYIETERPISAEEALKALRSAPGVVVVDDLHAKDRPYPTPLEVSGQDATYVGRLRKDPFVENGLSFWVVADNIRKGAATNAVQIAEELVRRGLV
ncbi:MAG: aspartate-semialdehyde dehydrogenase [Armatimonadota bacterium]